MKRVPPIGPKDARIVLLGESPGGEEVRAGVPFVGRAGKELDFLLQAAGLDREEIYITNTVKIEPPKGDKEKAAFFFNKGQPTDVYMQGIIEVLGELKEVRPNVVVPLGNYALWALTQKDKIMSWRGSIMESTMIPGQKVIPTIHPAYYIHAGGFNSHKEALGIWDLTRVKEESEFPEIILPRADFIINPTPAQIDEAIQRLLQSDHMTVDTEWRSPENLSCIGFTNDVDWAICIPAKSMKAYRAYKEILSSPVPKIMHNGMFDKVALARIGIHVENVLHDTMIAWAACWPGLEEKSLQVVCSVLTRWPYYKDQVEFIKEDSDQGWTYNATDCVVQEESWRKIDTEEFEYTGGRAGYNISMSIFDIFANASIKGIKANRAKLKEMREEHLATADHLEGVLSDTIGYKINCRSPDQVRKLIYEQLGVKRQEKTTKQEVLLDIAAATHDETLKAVITAVVRVRQNRNICSRYLTEEIIDKDDRIRTDWKLSGTGAGRLASGESWWNSVALQTVPEEARVCMVADDGCSFLGWDLEQAEARVVAIKTKDYDLIDEMNSGVDIHTKLAAMLPFGRTYDDLVAACIQAEMEGKSKDTVFERYLSKKCRHAFNYVMGSSTFRLTVNRFYLDTGIGIDERQARQLRAAYLQLHPGLEIWWEEIRAIAYRNPRVLSNCHGRTRNFLGQVTEQMVKEMVSYEPQSTVGDLTTISIAAADKRIKDLDPNAQFFCHMHDGGFVQVADDVVPEAAAIIKEEMTRELIIDRTPLIIPVNVKVGKNWGEMKKVKVA